MSHTVCIYYKCYADTLHTNMYEADIRCRQHFQDIKYWYDKRTKFRLHGKKVSEYDQEILQSHTATNPRHHEEEQHNIYSNNISIIQ